MGAFRTAGFDVLAFPSAPRTHGWHDFWRPSDTATDNLRRVDLAVHEWIGLVVYRIRGFSDDWFPGPKDHGGSHRSPSVAYQPERPDRWCFLAAGRHDHLDLRSRTALA
jgi:hypothetical protein